MPDDTHGPSSPANGRDANGSVRPFPAFARRLADDEDVSFPLDLVAVQADDELVNALGARAATAPDAVDATGRALDVRDDADHLLGGLDADGADDRLVAMLAAWRAEIDAEPIPELVDLDTAVAAVHAGMAQQTADARRRRAGRLRQLAPLAAAAAVIVATVTGVGVGSQGAMPGDTLWPIQKVVNPERAESVEAKVKVESRLETVRDALKKGDTVTAATELDAIRTEIPAVRGQEGKPELVQEQTFLSAKLADTPPGQPADLSTPPKSDPTARPTGTAPAPSADPSVADSSASPSASGSKSPAPDTRTSADRSKDAVAPVPVRTQPPAPDQSAPDVTSAPEATQPKPSSPTKPGKTEGRPDPSSAPGPVDKPPASAPAPAPEPAPASGADSPGDDGAGSGGSGGGTPGTTTAAGSAGADVHTTATDSTS